MTTPDETVRAFIQAHHAWETAATARRGTSDATAVAEREYADLIARFCAASVQPQGISFGDETMHHPDREVVESVTVDGDSAIVRSKHTRDPGQFEFVLDYEYHLGRESDAWRITSLLYVDDDGKYECL